MKKLFVLVLMLVLVFSGMAFADCTVTVNWTISDSADAASQQVLYDDDSQAAGGEVVKSSNLTMDKTTFTFNIEAPLPNDEIWVRTLDVDSNYADSTHIPVGGLNAATGIQTITICQ